MQGGVSINVGDFSDPTIYEVLESNDESLYLSTLYNGLWFWTTSSTYVNSVRVSTIFDIPNAEHIIGTYNGTYVDGLGSLDYGTYNYYGDGTLQAQYNTADYPQLDIVASAGTDGAIELGGSELSKINLVEYDSKIYASTFTFDLSIIATQAQSRMEDVNASAVLPASAVATVENFEQELLNSYEYYMDITLTEYKDKTESELIDIFSNMSSDYAMSSISRGVDGYYDWYFLANRYININQYFEGEYGDGEEPMFAPSRTQTDEVEKTLTKRPFSIGLDVSKVW